MKIIKLTSENVKRLKAVEITPEGALVVVGGDNAAGKTSVLDSIEYALGGQPAASQPVRTGETRARIVVDLGDLVVTRTITPTGGGSLVVANAEGIKQGTPQGILDRLVGKLAFDPLAFSRQPPKAQAETLRALMGIDLSDYDTDRRLAYEERTAANREVRRLEDALATTTGYVGMPAQPIDLNDILDALAHATRNNAENESKRRVVDACAREVTRLSAKLEVANLNHKAALEAAKGLADIDLAAFRLRATEADEINEKVRSNQFRAETVAALAAQKKCVDALTKEINEIDADKLAKIAAAQFPVLGLGFDLAGNVTFNNIPFDQCSSAEQLRVSVAIGIAMNPKLRVLLIRDGSLLDDNGLNLLARMASESGSQVWIERVGSDQHTSVVIEDGQVADNRTQ